MVLTLIVLLSLPAYVTAPEFDYVILQHRELQTSVVGLCVRESKCYVSYIAGPGVQGLGDNGGGCNRGLPRGSLQPGRCSTLRTLCSRSCREAADRQEAAPFRSVALNHPKP